MHIKKDHELELRLKKHSSVVCSDEFTDGVMRRLPKRNVAQGWSVFFLILVWISFMSWVWFWRMDLFYNLTDFSLDLRNQQWSAFVPYLAFVMGLTIVMWETYDFFSKKILLAKGL